MSRKNPGLLREAASLHAELLVVNGLDASELNEPLVDNLYAGGVGANLVTGLRLGERPLIRPGSPHLRFVLDHADRVAHVDSVRGIRQAKRDGKVAIVFGWQSPEYLGEDLSGLDGFHRMGLRSVGLVYNVGSYVGSGCVDPHQGGLSHFGVELVHRLEELRIVVDVGGHTSEATSFDAIEVARKPVVCSHTNPRSLRDNPRAMTDGLFRAIVDTGGVIGITAFSYFLAAEGRGTLDDYLDHVDYAVDLVGADHVGLGLDQIIGRQISGPANQRRFPPDAYPPQYEDWIYPEELTDFTGVPLITAGLIERGYRQEDIAKIMGENWLSIWEEIWGE